MNKYIIRYLFSFYQILPMFQKKNRNSISLLILCLVLIHLGSAQNICYVNCAYGSCLQTDILSCTGCDPGFLLINSQCIPTGGQSLPVQKKFTPVSQTQIQGESFRKNDMVACRINYPIANPSQIVFANQTVSRAKYRVGPLSLFVPGEHQYVQIKMNVILFNNRRTPDIFMLVVNSDDQNQISKTLQPNNTQYGVSCNGIPASSPFYISEKISSKNQLFNIELQTRAEGDELGIANLQIYAGNCHPSCAECFGSTNRQCSACRGLFRYNNFTKSCDSCPQNFYVEGDLCLPCPPNCNGCRKQSGVVKCISCDTNLQRGLELPQCVLTIQVINSLTALTFNDRDQWISDEVGTDVLSACGSFNLIGGTPKGRGLSVLSRKFTELKIHSQIWIKFLIFLIDQQPESTYIVSVEVDQQVFQRTVSVNPNNQSNSQCGTSDLEYVEIIELNNIQHARDNVVVKISGISNFFGIRDFSLGVINTTQTQNCFSVSPNDQSTCVQCNYGYQLTSNSTCNLCPEGYYENQNQCEICPIFCRSCELDLATGEPICKSCDKPLNQNQQKNECADDEGLMYTIEIFPNVDEIVNNQWTFYPKLQTKGFDKCGNATILGSTTIKYRSLVMTRQFKDLPTHRGVSIHFFFYQIDDYDDFEDEANNLHQVYFMLGGQKFPYIVSNNRKQICGNSTLDSVEKVILALPGHTASTLKLEVHGNRTKLGINNVLVFLQSCADCQNNVNYQLQTMPIYSIDTPPDKGIKTKLIFDQKINSVANISDLIDFELIKNDQKLEQGTGLFTELQLLQTSFENQRELVQLRALSKNHFNDSVRSIIQNPGSIFAEGLNINKPASSKSLTAPFPRYDEINEADKNQRSNMRNIQNLFRGIAILAMFIGLASFLFGLSSAFDDLFLICQIIFVHIFIQGSYNPISFKIPVSGMQVVQFMLWLPIEGRVEIEKGIIPSNHYQRSPIIYEEYFQDISFARTIYHTVLFFIAMLVFYGIVWVCITGFSAKREKERGFIAKYYDRERKKKFVFLNKVIRFAYFTVVWAAALQFTWFQNQPQSFNVWNSIVTIIFFILAVLYPIIGFLYIRNKFNSLSRQTFENLYFELRIEGGKKWFYFLFFYYKLLAFALLIGLLYASNPLAVLIPLIALNIIDGIILIIVKPYYLEYPEEKIGSFFTKKYLFYYWISHIIQNFLLAILQILMIVLYAQRITASTISYLGIGYACCVFIALLLFNGLIRMGWNLIQIFEDCYDHIKSEDVRVESVEENAPLKEVQGPLPTTVRMMPSQVHKISLDNRMIQ